MILSVDFSVPFPRNSRFLSTRRPLVLTCGCFDVLTVGHVRHLEEAKRLGTCLCVLVTADQHVDKPGRPVFPQEVRAEVVDALRCVDFTLLNSRPTAVEAIRCLQPDFYVKGREYEGSVGRRIGEEGAAVRAAGGTVVFTDTEELHTTDVLETLRCR